MEEFSALPPALQEYISRLSTPLNPGQVKPLQAALSDYEKQVMKAAQEHAFVDVALAARLKAVATALLERYSGLEGERRKWASAAIKYFLLRDDFRNGFTSPTGFEDDALVMNAVVTALGWPELRVGDREKIRPAP